MFSIEIEICGRCGGSVRVIVDASNRCIEDQDIVDRILAHLREKEQEAPFSRERARGSRTRVIAVQSARTPLNIWSAWNSVGYSLETTTKDLQVDQCKRDLGKLDGHRLVQCM